jgi:hypothetical protein
MFESIREISLYIRGFQKLDALSGEKPKSIHDKNAGLGVYLHVCLACIRSLGSVPTHAQMLVRACVHKCAHIQSLENQ